MSQQGQPAPSFPPMPIFDPTDPLGSLVAAQRSIWKALPIEALDDLLTALVEEIDGRAK